MPPAGRSTALLCLSAGQCVSRLLKEPQAPGEGPTLNAQILAAQPRSPRREAPWGRGWAGPGLGLHHRGHRLPRGPQRAWGTWWGRALEEQGGDKTRSGVLCGGEVPGDWPCCPVSGQLGGHLNWRRPDGAGLPPPAQGRPPRARGPETTGGRREQRFPRRTVNPEGIPGAAEGPECSGRKKEIGERRFHQPREKPGLQPDGAVVRRRGHVLETGARSRVGPSHGFPLSTQTLQQPVGATNVAVGSRKKRFSHVEES